MTLTSIHSSALPNTLTPQIDNDDLLYQIAITKISKVGHKNAKRLIAHFGTPKNVFKASKKELSEIFGIGDARVTEIKSDIPLQKAYKELAYNKEHGIRAIFFNDEDYPRRLREVEDGPIVIYVRGNADLNPERMISVVGTRKPSNLGAHLCSRLIEDLKEYNPTIVSGLAFGVDAIAHRTALECGLPTIGVVAHGHGDMYPAQHRSLAERMSANGAVLSEFTHNITAEREFFPMRNRIIAGLGDAVVVVQTAKKGGSMISADLANAYSRDVFTFPGRVGDQAFQGCNLLIKENRAQLIESAADLAFQLGWDQPKPKVFQTELFAQLTEQEAALVDLFKDAPELSIDQISARAKLPLSQLSNLLLQMEFKSILLSHPGKKYSLFT